MLKDFTTLAIYRRSSTSNRAPRTSSAISSDGGAVEIPCSDRIFRQLPIASSDIQKTKMWDVRDCHTLLSLLDSQLQSTQAACLNSRNPQAPEVMAYDPPYLLPILTDVWVGSPQYKEWIEHILVSRRGGGGDAPRHLPRVRARGSLHPLLVEPAPRDAKLVLVTENQGDTCALDQGVAIIPSAMQVQRLTKVLKERYTIQVHPDFSGRFSVQICTQTGVYLPPQERKLNPPPDVLHPLPLTDLAL